MFHAIGWMAIAWAVYSGLELAVFRPARPPIAVNATSYLIDLVESKSEWAMLVPAPVEVSLPVAMRVRRADHLTCT